MNTLLGREESIGAPVNHFTCYTQRPREEEGRGEGGGEAAAEGKTAHMTFIQKPSFQSRLKYAAREQGF